MKALNFNDPVLQPDGSLKELQDMGGGDPYVLPVASEETLGGIKLTDDFEIDEDGAMSLADPIPTHAAAQSGKILSVDAEGGLIWINPPSGGIPGKYLKGITPDLGFYINSSGKLLASSAAKYIAYELNATPDNPKSFNIFTEYSSVYLNLACVDEIIEGDTTEHKSLSSGTMYKCENYTHKYLVISTSSPSSTWVDEKLTNGFILESI